MLSARPVGMTTDELRNLVGPFKQLITLFGPSFRDSSIK